MEMDLTDSGFDTAIANLQAIAPALAADVIGRGLRAAAKVVAQRAKEIVPVRTGALRDSIRARAATSLITTSSGRKKVSGTAAVVQAGSRGAFGSATRIRAAHAVLIEYGTVNSPAKPFLEPAITQTMISTISSNTRCRGARLC